jgi:hypothetical protein
MGDERVGARRHTGLARGLALPGDRALTNDAVKTVHVSGIAPTAIGRIERYFSILFFVVTMRGSRQRSGSASRPG